MILFIRKILAYNSLTSLYTFYLLKLFIYNNIIIILNSFFLSLIKCLLILNSFILLYKLIIKALINPFITYRLFTTLYNYF
jgi:hypothetical protein